ncbi:uncharacterized protein K452DRAFT_253883 [Aplosporella prunicola CBS 121167]|uniref:Meiotic recombination protein DMC1 n=1 Tax=Aplosporella prunicola CBS 121167 TaxID=1176127 RepID=A0A6A6B9Q4_9PEZI|nr:uncharacterized protein K452DRAFT_253883 [Aplosporella prunicola CBS 121167]KAF2140093.1 hypothetical protein K452DRAFT_253883 [Aplosporella prunicola CBS 121167]
MTSPSASAAGGFFRPSVLSPPPSSSTATSALPHPRSKPLKTGGNKESAFIRYVDERIRQIQRRFAKRGTGGTVTGDVKGYDNFADASKEVDQLVDVVWVSGTPSLQIAYLISLALLINDFMAGFSPMPKALFRILDKLDHAFASLLQGRDTETGEELPGFEGGRTVNATEKVRIYSMVQNARIQVVDVMAKYDPLAHAEENETESEMTEVMDTDVDEEFGLDDMEGAWDMQVAKVYDRTVVELGDSIGMRTENPLNANASAS